MIIRVRNWYSWAPVTNEFYDDLADSFHLIYENWPASIERQAAALTSLIGDTARDIADVAAGVGTQSLGLAARGYRVTASDLSPRAIARLQREAAQRGLSIETRVDDMLQLSTYADASADAVIACDNSVPHLLSDELLLQAFRQFHRILRPGGLCILSVRDYTALPPARLRFNPQGVRELPGGGHVSVFQVWEYEGQQYELSQYLVFDEGGRVETRVFRTRYYAVSIETLMRLMRQAGFEDVRRIDDLMFQPVIVASRPTPPARSARSSE